MRYIRKTSTGMMEEYFGRPVRGAWYTENGYIGYSGDLQLSRLDIVDGVVIELPEPEPTAEWVPISAFIGALYTLIPAETVAAVLQNPEALKPGLAGLALLSSDAAPGGMIDLLDSRVAEWLALVNLTLEQVREKMNYEVIE